MKVLKKIIKWTAVFICVLLFIFIILLIIPEKETVSAIQPRENTRYWSMSEDFRIAYTYLPGTDSIKKAPVIFVHGGPGGYVHSSIINTLNHLSKSGFDIYLYDQRGSGLSDRMKKYSDVGFEKHIADLHEIITEHIQSEKAILIGQSFGANIITHYSTRFPERVEKLIMCSPGSLRPHRKIGNQYADLDSLYPAPDSLQFIEPYNFTKDVNRMAAKPKAIVSTLGALLFDKKLISDRQMDRMLNTLASRFTRGMVCDPNNVLPEEGGGGLYAFLATNNDDFPEIRKTIQNLDIPVLVLQGQCEYHPYGSAYEYVDLFPNARYVFIEAAGHEIWWEQEEKYLEELEEFLNEGR